MKPRLVAENIKFLVIHHGLKKDIFLMNNYQVVNMVVLLLGMITIKE